MPVVLTHNQPASSSIAPTPGKHPSAECVEKSSRTLKIGLINNMSDGALEATERQFISRLESASEGLTVELSFYSLPGIVRNEFGAHRVNRCYASAETLLHSHVDALIVTGREPLHPNLEDEPYWVSFAKVLEWAREHTFSTIWSCLAAHGAVLFQDGIRRAPARNKHFGVYECTTVADHPLTAGLPQCFATPHSRWNGLSAEQLGARGYRVLSQAGEAGVDMFAQQHKSLFVYFQGHPEYEAKTLLLEYRRDVWRFLRGESESYPLTPAGYFDAATEARLAEMQSRAGRAGADAAGREVEEILSGAQTSDAWFATSSIIYRNWLQYICAQKKMRLAAQAALNACSMMRVPGLAAIVQDPAAMMRDNWIVTV